MKTWSDIAMVEAVANHDTRMVERFYRDCKAYFARHASALFLPGGQAEDIFQEAFVHLWREIETRRIEVRDGRVCRWQEGTPQPMTGALFTFLLAVAKRKHWEQLRKDAHLLLAEDSDTLDRLDHGRYAASGTEADGAADDELRERIVADAVLAMSDRCRQILTLFYYENRTLDEILLARPENTSKVGLKTSKYKCMQRLRDTVRDRFRQLHLHL